MATEQEATPLGARVERTLIELIEAGLRHGPAEKLAIADCDSCQQALAIARSRIRERMAEPKPEPPPEFIVAESFVDRHDIHHRIGEPLPRTSKHSLDWLMDTSPENLLKLERLSNTVYVLLGHRDPDKLAAWINQAHAAARPITVHQFSFERMMLAAVVHQLGYGEASEGNPEDLAWCIRELQMVDRKLSKANKAFTAALDSATQPG